MRSYFRALSMALALTTLTLTGSALSLFKAAEAADYPKKPYECWTDFYSGGQVSSQNHIWCDGRGKMRSEMNTAGRKYVTVMDFPNNVSYGIDDASRTINKTSLDPSKMGYPDQKINWQQLGVKVVEGRPCKGQRSVVDGHTHEMWSDVGTECGVLLTMDGATVYKLRTLSPAVPAASLFELPTGYKVVDTAQFLKQMGTPQSP